MTRTRPGAAALLSAALLLPLGALPTAAAGQEASPPPPQSTAAFCAPVAEAFQPFTDVGDDTHAAAIRCAAYAEIARGGPGTLPAERYGPAMPVRRDQMASFIARMMDTANQLDTGDAIRALPAYSGAPRFSDVGPDSVHVEAVHRLEQAGIVRGGPSGRPADQYGPELPTQRGQMAAFVHRAVEYMTGSAFATSEDFFVDDETSVHEDDINGVASAGIAVGDGSGRYSPGQDVPRAQMASFLLRALAVLHDDGLLGQVTALTVAAVDADGRAVVLHAGTGAVLRVLLEGVDVDDPSSNSIAVSPDRSTVYLVRPARAAGEDSQIVRIPATGGEPQVVTQGQSPAVSPDGTTLAYVRFLDTPEPGHPEPTVRLRDLTTGDERELRGEQQQFFGIWDLAWTSDGSRLAFTAGEIRLGVHVLDRDALSLDAATRLGPEDLDASWSDLAALGPGRLAVIERCCSVAEPERWRVVSIDAATGAVLGEVLGRERTEATLVDDRQDGTGLLLLQYTGRPGGAPLLRWDGRGELRQIADRIIVAAW